jgi:Domain of unknown function (DUF397)
MQVIDIQWRKSSYSGNGGQDCIEVGAVPWRKSSYSGNGGQDCIEAGHVASAVLIRDTKDNERGPVLRVTVSDWRRFTATIRVTGGVS